MIFKIIGIFIVTCSLAGAWQFPSGPSKEKEKWVEPNAWAKSLEVEVPPEDGFRGGFCACSNEHNTADVSSRNQAAAFVLKKFVRQLFGREKLQYDEQFLLYQRNVLFSILPAQVEQLEELEDPRDLDNVLTEILNNVRTPNDYKDSGSWTIIFALIWDILKDCVLLLRFSEVRFMTFVVLIILAGWFIHRKHKISIVLMILVGVFIFGFFHTYLECNRELEMKQMIEAIEHSERITKTYNSNWFSSLTSWFGNSPKEILKKEQHEKIKRESRLNLSFCRPDHVLIMYMNDVFMKQLEFMVEKCISSVNKIRESFGFPYNIIAVVGLVTLLVTFIKLTFEHIISPRVWLGYFQRGDVSIANATHHPALTDNNEDRLSGENLKILLKAISMPKDRFIMATSEMSSSVQDVYEPIEPPTGHGDSFNSSSNSSSNCTNTNLKNNSNPCFCSKSDINLTECACTISALLGEVILKEESSTRLKRGADANFEIVSDVKSKVLIEDLPTDCD